MGEWQLRTEHPAYQTGKPSEVVIYSEEREVLRTLSENADLDDFFLILRAVNSHEELLEAAKGVLTRYPELPRLRDAVAKAESSTQLESRQSCT